MLFCLIRCRVHLLRPFPRASPAGPRVFARERTNVYICISGARTIAGFRGNTINNMAATAATQKEKDPVNIVHQNAIFCETILKEQRHQKLYTSYGVNPYKKSKHSTSVTHVTFEL